LREGTAILIEKNKIKRYKDQTEITKTMDDEIIKEVAEESSEGAHRGCPGRVVWSSGLVEVTKIEQVQKKKETEMMEQGQIKNRGGDTKKGTD
jgi:hypothetical protein